MVFPLKLRDVFVPSGHLWTIQGPETAHHFDGALRRYVGHLPRFADENSQYNTVDPRSRADRASKGGPAPRSQPETRMGSDFQQWMAIFF